MFFGDPLLQKNPDGTQSTVLRNKANLNTQAALDSFEATVVTGIRAPDLRKENESLAVTGSARAEGVLSQLQRYHKTLFQDVYDWAGETREVNMAKKDPISHEATRFEYIASLGLDPAKVTDADREAAKSEFAYLGHKIDDWLASQPAQPGNKGVYARQMADLYSRVNDLHPFREGNGRAARMLLHSEALRHGYRLNLDRVPKADWIAASVAGSRGDTLKIAKIISQYSELRQSVAASSERPMESPVVPSGAQRIKNWLERCGLEATLGSAQEILDAARSGETIVLEIGRDRVALPSATALAVAGVSRPKLSSTPACGAVLSHEAKSSVRER